MDKPLSTDSAQEGVVDAKKVYLAVWRWHFYSGLYVIPFIIMLSVTGLLMMYAPQIEHFQYRNLFFVAVQGQVQPYAAQLEAAKRAFPEAKVKRFEPNGAPDRTSQVSMALPDKTDITVFVNPYTLEVLGSLKNKERLGNIADEIHGNLLIATEVNIPGVGKVNLGDLLIEIAAGLMLVLITTGLYLWWPRDKQGVYLVPKPGLKGRLFWKGLHGSLMFWGAGALLFFAVSGLAWTGIWGSKYVQAWSTFPAEKFKNVPKSTQPMASLNGWGETQVPWNLEQSKLPLSGSMAGKEGIPTGVAVNLDTVIQYARENGFNERLRVAPPRGPEGVWTVSATAIGGDVTDARRERTLHIDQYSGKVLADIGWSQYSLGAKAMAAGTGLHKGNYGWWSMALNTLFCLLFILGALASLAMWWARRPAGVFRLAAPPLPKNMPLWKGAVLLIALVGVVVPTVGVVLLLALVLDLALIQRIPVLKERIG